MLAEFTAEADVRGNRIDLEWTWSAPGDRPGLRLLRRRWSYPAGVADGLPVLDVADLFSGPDQTWGTIVRVRYLIPNTLAEGGLLQAEVSLYGPDAATPSQVRVAHYDGAAGSMADVLIGEVSRVESASAPTPPWASVETVQIFATPGGGPEEQMGQIVISRGHSDGLTPDRWEWTLTAGPTVTLDIDQVEIQQTRISSTGLVDGMFEAQMRTDIRTDGEDFSTAMLTDEENLLRIRNTALVETFNLDNGDWERSVVVEDQVLAPEQIYYYALFAPDPENPGAFLSERTWRASAMATGRYGLADRLYALLPGVHKQYDEPTPELRGKGQLRRFLEICGSALDQIRSLAEGLRGRHDVLEVGADVLPHLARWIGWEPDRTLAEHAQRNDILFAPEVYETVGAVPNIRALVNRGTGWECRVKEFVNNVFLTNAPEIVHLWEIWESRNGGADWSIPASITQTEHFDGRPAAALDSGGDVWLFWHANRGDRREIWLQRQDGVDASPRRAMLDAPDDEAGLTYTDEYPTAMAEGTRIWLFWCSDREGSRDIWARPFDGLPGGAPERLTEHPANDRNPAAVRRNVAGETWVFWQSDRRGPSDIWARVHNGVEWSLPSRITTAQFRHEMPAAVVDASERIWLFWSADLGDRRNLFVQVFDGSNWGEAQPVTAGPHRDEAPTAAFWDGQVRLFWHSNRDGRWQIWGSTNDTVDVTDWSAPSPLTAHATPDKEAAAVVDGSGDLRLYWRSQRRADRYKSRTIDVDDTQMLDRLGAFEDRAHYTYDTEEMNQDWYARGVVGLYLTPDTGDSAEIARQVLRVRRFVEPFRPMPVRFVWLTDSFVLDEIINTDGLIDEAFEDEIS